MIKLDYMLISGIMFGVGGYCYWYNYTQVAPNSVKDVLDMCRWASFLLGGFSLGLALSKFWEKK
jgi:ABC-type branched-subunit amino acid transport system permease subunit